MAVGRSYGCHPCTQCRLSKLQSLSLKDNPCQRSAHQQKHDPQTQRVKPNSSRGVNSRVMRGKATGEGGGPRARCQPPGVRNGRPSTPHISLPTEAQCILVLLKRPACMRPCWTCKYSRGCVLSLCEPPPYPSSD